MKINRYFQCNYYESADLRGKSEKKNYFDPLSLACIFPFSMAFGSNVIAQFQKCCVCRFVRISKRLSVKELREDKMLLVLLFGLNGKKVKFLHWKVSFLWPDYFVYCVIFFGKLIISKLILFKNWHFIKTGIVKSNIYPCKRRFKQGGIEGHRQLCWA